MTTHTEPTGQTEQTELAEPTELAGREECREFVVHNIQLTVPNPKVDFDHVDNPDRPAQNYPQDYLYRALCDREKKIPFSRNRKGRGQEDVPCAVLRAEGGIVLLRVHNHLLPVLYELSGEPGEAERCEATTHDSYPFAYVVVDCRDGKCQMAIERSKDWTYYTEPIRKCLEEGFAASELLHGLGIEVEIRKKTIATRCVEFVDRRINSEGDVLKTVTMEFANRERQPTVRVPDGIADMMNGLSRQLEIMDAVKGETTYQMRERDAYDQERLDALGHVVSMCADNAFDLSFGFRDFGKYVYNEAIEARFSMNDVVLSQFAEGIRPEYRDREHDMVAWLDDVFDEVRSIEDGIPSKPQD